MTAVRVRFTKFDATVSYNALRLPLVGAGCVRRLPRQVDTDTTYVPFAAPLFPVTARRHGPHGGNNVNRIKALTANFLRPSGRCGFEPLNLISIQIRYPMQLTTTMPIRW